MRKQKPVPIKLLNPKFENFVKGRDHDPDCGRVERRKLNKLLKREAKGAARELWKDNHFLYEAKQREKAMLDEEKAEMYGKAKAFLQEQEHAFKSGQWGKGRKRRRSLNCSHMASDEFLRMLPFLFETFSSPQNKKKKDNRRRGFSMLFARGIPSGMEQNCHVQVNRIFSFSSSSENRL